jgi:hypothetical protein
MTTIELDDTERAALIELLRDQIKNTRWRLASPRTKALRSIIAKLAPPGPQPCQPPKPLAQPSIILAKRKHRPR